MVRWQLTGGNHVLQPGVFELLFVRLLLLGLQLPGQSDHTLLTLVHSSIELANLALRLQGPKKKKKNEEKMKKNEGKMFRNMKKKKMVSRTAARSSSSFLTRGP